MTASLREKGSSTYLRPGDSCRSRAERPTTRELRADNAAMDPLSSRQSSFNSRLVKPVSPSSTTRATSHKSSRTLTHAYMVCGVGREPSQWVRAPAPSQGSVQHMKNAVPQFWMAEILGSSPRLEQDNEIARALHSAMRACFPHDVEICTGKSQPHCTHHSFVLQQDASQTLYGISLRVWSRADGKRAETIRCVRRRTESDFIDDAEETYWIPYCLSFLSRYPLFNLLGDYLRGMWIHWNKSTNLFHAEEVSRILSFPAPRLNDLVRIDMKEYALCYLFPPTPNEFQNFDMWPLFSCLSIPNIVGVIEAALSPNRRIIFVSHHPAMLTAAAETVRYCVRVHEWSGLYCPVVHARSVRSLTEEPGPYILGVTAECRTLLTPPADAIVIDLDHNFVLTTQPPNVLSNGQRAKMITRLAQALNGDVTPTGVPQHLRAAYAGGKLHPAGQIIVFRGHVETVQEPEWWNQDGVVAVMDHVCGKMGRNTGLRALFSGSIKKPVNTKVSMRYLNELTRERNQFSRDAMEAWQDFINLKGRMDTEVSKVSKRNNFLIEELDTWKGQFQRFQTFAEALTKETNELKNKIEHHKKENRRLNNQVETHRDEVNRLTLRLQGTEKQRDDALEALVLQQEIAEELERERKRNVKEINSLEHMNTSLVRQRDEAQHVVLHLRSLITGQAHHMEHIVHTLNSDPETTGFLDEGFEQTIERTKRKSSKTQKQLSHGRTESVNLEAFANAKEEEAAGNNNDDDGGEEEGKLSTTMEDNLLNLDHAREQLRSPSTRSDFSHSSIADVADRNIRDKTDAITEIIRNISDQCAAAVEGLQLAHDADVNDVTDDDEEEEEEDEEEDEDEEDEEDIPHHATSSTSTGTLDDNANTNSNIVQYGSHHNDDSKQQSLSVASGSQYSSYTDDMAEENHDSFYVGTSRGDVRASSVPPTPDLMTCRSSTSMSYHSGSGIFSSINGAAGHNGSSALPTEKNSHSGSNYGEYPTRILEDDRGEAEQEAHERDSGIVSGLDLSMRPLALRQVKRHGSRRNLTPRGSSSLMP